MTICLQREDYELFACSFLFLFGLGGGRLLFWPRCTSAAAKIFGCIAANRVPAGRKKVRRQTCLCLRHERQMHELMKAAAPAPTCPTFLAGASSNLLLADGKRKQNINHETREQGGTT